jgi:hypothetical protein
MIIIYVMSQNSQCDTEIRYIGENDDKATLWRE